MEIISELSRGQPVADTEFLQYQRIRKYHGKSSYFMGNGRANRGYRSTLDARHA